MTDETPTAAQLAAMPISDHFQYLIDREAEQRGGVAPLATIDLHHADGTGLGPRIRRWTFDEFDEESIGEFTRPGRNMLVLRFAGERQFQAQRPILGKATSPVSAREPIAAEPPAMMQPPTPTYGPDALVTLMMTMMQQQAQQAQEAARQHQEMNTLLLGRLLDTANAPRERNLLEQMLEIDELIDRRAARRERGDGDSIGEAVGPLATALAEAIKSGKPLPAAAITAKPPEPPKPAAPEPADAAVSASAKLIRGIAGVLSIGGKQENPDPDRYAENVLDLVEAAGFDPADVLAALPEQGLAPMLIQQYPALNPEFVGRVEAALRDQITGSDDEPQEDPDHASD